MSNDGKTYQIYFNVKAKNIQDAIRVAIKEMQRNPNKTIKEIGDKMTELNTRIENDKNLGKGFKIGHSYFCPQEGIVPNRDWFQNIITSEIEQLLQEYWFDNQDEAESAVKKLLS